MIIYYILFRMSFWGEGVALEHEETCPFAKWPLETLAVPLMTEVAPPTSLKGLAVSLEIRRVVGFRGVSCMML